MKEMNLETLIMNVSSLNWKYWVYCEPYEKLALDLNCVVLNVDECELGSDDFTPLIVENYGFCELISIQDLQGLIKNTNSSENDVSSVLIALENFIEKDGYI